MALTINNSISGGTLSNKYPTTTTTTTATTTNTQFSLLHHRQFLPSFLSLSSRTTTTSTVVVAATGKFRTGKFDSKNRRTSTTTTTKDGDAVKDKKNDLLRNFEDDDDDDNVDDSVDDGVVVPQLPGENPDFWEGPQWDAFGFFVQYLWAFGILFALISSGIAVATYNEGATDFRQTPAYKESIQSKDLLEGPEASDADVFESNPTEEAPALE